MCPQTLSLDAPSMVYPPPEVCGTGTEAIQQFLCQGKARQPASFTQWAHAAPRSCPGPSQAREATETGEATGWQETGYT